MLKERCSLKGWVAMRDYGKVGPKFWIGDTGKALKKAGQEAVIIGLYLMTSPHSNMLGLYYLPEIYIAHETGLGIEGTTKGLRSCIEAGFCAYDKASEMVWVFEMANFQIAERLLPTDKRSLGVQNAYDELPRNPYLAPFHEKYGTAFNMTSKREYGVPTGDPKEGPSTGLASQEQEQEQEQKQDQTQLSLSGNPPPQPDPEQEVIDKIFGYWQKTMQTPRSKLDAARTKAIKRGLKLKFDPADLCRAIRGCSLTPFNMGDNKDRKKHNDLDLIFRDAKHIEGFIETDKNPPTPATAGGRRGEPTQADRDAEREKAKALLFGPAVPRSELEHG